MEVSSQTLANLSKFGEFYHEFRAISRLFNQNLEVNSKILWKIFNFLGQIP